MFAKEFSLPKLGDAAGRGERTVSITMEDLINNAMGPPEGNRVNFKLIQTILHILARQMRIQEHFVDLRYDYLQSSNIKAKHGTEQKQKEKDREISDNENQREGNEKAIEKPKRYTVSENAKELDIKEKKNALSEKMRDLEQDEYKKEEAIEHDRKGKPQLEKKTDKERSGYKGRKDNEQDMEEKAKLDKSTDKERAAYGTEYEGQTDEEQDLKEKAKLEEKTDKERAEHKGQKNKEQNMEENAKFEKKTDLDGVEYEVPIEQDVKETAKQETKANLSKIFDKAREEYRQHVEKINEMDKEEKAHRLREANEPLSPVGSVEVVSRSEFDLLLDRVHHLEKRVAPIPYLFFPFHWTSTSELSVGSLSTDPEQAWQVMKRLQVAEEAIGRLAGVLTILLAYSDLPENVSEKAMQDTAGISSTFAEKIKLLAAALGTTMDSTVSFKLGSGVTHAELDYVVNLLKDDLIKNARTETSETQKTAKKAFDTVENLVEETKAFTDIKNRMSQLHLLIDDYATQLASFDAMGIAVQLSSFYEQMVNVQKELKSGEALFREWNDKETEDVKDLKVMYDELVKEQNVTKWSLKQLTEYQDQLDEELKESLKRVEVLREEKVDLDTLLDLIRDKADRSELAGLLLISEFNKPMMHMNTELSNLIEKYELQDQTWMLALKEFHDYTRRKADIDTLMDMKYDFETDLVHLQQGLNRLARLLGRPKAALLTRQISLAGQCGACADDALPAITPGFGHPPQLPALRRHFPTPDTICQSVGTLLPPVNTRSIRAHVCRRWTGGSHTLLTDKVTRAESPTIPSAPPTDKYSGYGNDGKLYMMEKIREPCCECNPPQEVAKVMDEAGDTGVTTTKG